MILHASFSYHGRIWVVDLVQPTIALSILRLGVARTNQSCKAVEFAPRWEELCVVLNAEGIVGFQRTRPQSSNWDSTVTPGISF